MSMDPPADEQITAAVTAWPGVQAGLGSRGEYGFSVGRRQIGHLHGDRVAHFGFPRATWEQLMAEGRVTKHPIDKPGWAARQPRDRGRRARRDRAHAPELRPRRRAPRRAGGGLTVQAAVISSFGPPEVLVARGRRGPAAGPG